MSDDRKGWPVRDWLDLLAEWDAARKAAQADPAQAPRAAAVERRVGEFQRHLADVLGMMLRAHVAVNRPDDTLRVLLGDAVAEAIAGRFAAWQTVADEAVRAVERLRAENQQQRKRLDSLERRQGVKAAG